MLTKEKFLKDKISLYIKSPESNEDYVKLIQKLIDLGWRTYDNTPAENLSHFTCICLPHIDEEYFEIHPRVDPGGYKELQVSDILEENNQFEVGKWYSFYWNWSSRYDIVAKVSKLGQVVGFDNFINITQGGHLDQNFNAIRLTEIENIKELTLEEVQQYLPDKIVKEFVLPEKWCVKSTNDTIKVLNDFINSKGYESTLSSNYYIHYPFLNGAGAAYSDIRVGYTEITFDQFKQYVLKESVKEEEDFSKSLLEPKPLTVDDLVEGEIYYWQPKDNNNDWWIRYCLNSGTNISNLKISQDYFDAGHGTLNPNSYIISKATTDQIKHLKVCEKQNEFIEQSELDKYDDEGNLIEVISKPETKEPKEMQLSDLKNPVFNIGDKVRVIADSLREFNSSWRDGNNAKYKKGYEGLITWCYLDYNVNDISCNLLELVEPAKKEFDRNWYVEVNSQEEANKVFDWLESQGENTFRGHACFNKTFKYIRQWNNASSEYHNKWFLSSEKNNKPQKQLSDIHPNYKQKCEVCGGKGGETRDGFCDPCSECEGEGYIENDIIKPPISPTKQIPEIEAVTNRFKASPIRKRSLPEIY